MSLPSSVRDRLTHERRSYVRCVNVANRSLGRGDRDSLDALYLAGIESSRVNHQISRYHAPHAHLRRQRDVHFGRADI
jgi:hypothetical protein